jgi:hypothetical protein
MANFWARKSIAVLEAEAQEKDVQALTTHDGVPLKRTLSAASLVSLGIGAIIGAGIFVLTGHAAAVNAGPAITVSFALGAIACGFVGRCYAEMASTVPIAGSAYTYAYATMGEFVAWIIGWDLILEYALGATTVAIGWSGYVVSFLKDFGIVVPNEFAGSPFAYDAATRVACDRGVHQRASGIGRRGNFRSPGYRCSRIGSAQQHHRRDQSCDRRHLYRDERLVRQHTELGDGEQSLGRVRPAK